MANDGTPYRTEQIPPRAVSKNTGGAFETAYRLTRGIHEAGEKAGWKEPEDPDFQWTFFESIKLTEAELLKKWATKHGVLLDNIAFTKNWEEQGSIEGGEHQIYIKDGRVYKRNNLTYHKTWLEYFNRVLLHNWLFPETAMHFEGFVIHNNKLQPVISQPFVLANRGANQNEVAEDMKKRGFDRVKADNYYNQNLGVLVEDLHDENVVISKLGNLVIFDPVLYMVKPGMRLPFPDWYKQSPQKVLDQNRSHFSKSPSPDIPSIDSVDPTISPNS